jgi:hypothetical protein
MPEERPALLGREGWNERFDTSRDAFDRSFGELAQQSLEWVKDQLDWIEVRGILRQIAQACADCGDGFLRTDNLVSWKIVHHNNVSTPERRRQALLQIGEEDFSVHGAVDQHWGNYSATAQAGDECDGFPVPERDMSDQALPAWAATVGPYHVGADGGLIEKHQFSGIEKPLLTNPPSPCPRYISALAFGRAQSFF